LSGQYDIAVLDVMMPGKGGIEVLGRIRVDSVMPVLMLSMSIWPVLSSRAT